MSKPKGQTIPHHPVWPTAMQRRLPDGRIIGNQSGVWLYKKIPLSPTVDAASTTRRLQAATPLTQAFNFLASTTRRLPTARRYATKGEYREIHLLLTNIPRWYQAPPISRIATELSENYRNIVTFDRSLLLGIRLHSTYRSYGNIRAIVDSIIDTWTGGGLDIATFDRDYQLIDAGLTEAGLLTPTDKEIRTVDSYFNHGNSNDPLIYPDIDGIGVARTAAAARHIQQNLTTLPVSQWEPTEHDQYHTISLAVVSQTDFGYMNATDPRSAWATDLINSGALAVSIRGLLEPAIITGREIDRQKEKYTNDLRSRHEAGKISRANQDQRLSELQQITDLYSTGGGSPTLTDASIVVCFPQIHPELDRLLPATSPIYLSPMIDRQQAALAETWIASPVRANPHRLDLPTPTIAYSELVSLSRVGDPPSQGAIQLGFTERDRQAVWWNPASAHEDRERAPIFLLGGGSGSGKTVLLQWIAYQLGKLSTPTVLFDPKSGSHLDPIVEAAGGTIISLETLLSADGILDPLRTAVSARLGIKDAASTILFINPWGSRLAEFETPLNIALSYGVDQGATCVGEALQIALQHGQAPTEMVDPLLQLAQTHEHVRALVGLNPNTKGLRVTDGLTYIKVGEGSLTLPGETTGILDQNQRATLALIRQVILGSVSALKHRNGVVLFDEAWTVMTAGGNEMEMVARTARSQGVTVVAATQRFSDASAHELDEHIIGGWALSFGGKKEKEARLACQLLGMEPKGRLSRLTAEDMSTGLGDTKVLNWGSLKALRDPETKTLRRGAVAYYADTYGEVVPVEIVIPDWFMARATTNLRDLREQGRLPARVGA